MKIISTTVIRKAISLMIVLLCSFSFSANAQCRLLNEPFNVNPVLSPTNVDGTWYPDRYPPSAFVSDVLGGNNVLKIHIDGTADGLSSRPAAYQSTFYNTQGRKFNQCGGCVTVLKGDLWIPADWASAHRRSDMWATAHDATNAISAYPIIGFRNVNGTTPGIYCYDVNTGDWIPSGVSVVYNNWYNLQFRLSGSNLEYLVNNVVVVTLPSGGSTYFGDIIMQAYNFNDPSISLPATQSADSYDAYWDNLITTGTGGKVVTNITSGLSYCTIQSAIDGASSGDVINVYPGNYNETAPNSSFNSGVYQFGLFFTSTKSNITVQGVKADGTPITNTADIAAFVTTNATNNFGYSGILVAGNNITLRGLDIGTNIPGDDKAIEVIGNGFTLNACRLSADAPVYIGDYNYNESGTPSNFNDDISSIQSYTISNCEFAGSTSTGGVYIANGAGWTGSNPSSVAGRSITGNTFDGMTTLSFAGLSPGVGWLLYPTGAATVTGNTFTNAENTRYIQSWGVVQAQFPYASYYNDNTFPKKTITTTDGNANNVRGYDASSAFLNLKRIGTVIQPRIDYAQAGDVILVGAGTYAGNITVNKSLTIIGDPGDALPGPGPSAPIIDGESLPGSAFFIANGVSNVTIKGFEMRNFTSNDNGVGNGISAWVVSTSNINVEDNYFHNLGYNGVLVGNDKSSDPAKWGDHSNWLIKNNILETFEAYGFELTNASNSSIENNIIHSNATWNLASTCIMVDARRNASGITIKGNELDGEMWPGYPAVFVFANSFELANVNLNDVHIENNIISTTGTVAQMRVHNYTGTGTVTGVSVNNNSLITFRNSTSVLIDATCNWWGSNCPATVGAMIDGAVTYSPFLLGGDDAAPGTVGFQPAAVCGAGAAITSVDGPPDPVALGTSIDITVNHNSTNPVSPYTINWGDETTAIGTVSSTPGSFTISHTYGAAGVYLVRGTVIDGCIEATFEYKYVVIYDPNGGFVTGSGWINSPAGAYVADLSLTGKATFGFVSKYVKGKTLPTGNTEFQFNAAGMSFKSTVYDWLVVAGTKAQFKGSGTINGSGDYGFMLSAIDGQITGGGGIDKFRIKIWEKTTKVVVYDNQIGAADNADPSTAIGGGSIVIHEVKKAGARTETNPVVVQGYKNFNVKVLGNPTFSSFRLKLESNKVNEKITMRIVDVNGRLIEVKQNLLSGQLIELGSRYNQGVYFAEVIQGDQRKVVKLIKIAQD